MLDILQHVAIGDAYGAGVEFLPDEEVKIFNKLKGYQEHPKYKLPAGSYTDDTQMSIAVVETMLAGEITEIAFADSFVRTFKRDEREAYAKGFYKFLLKTNSGKEFLENIKPDSIRNGAAMRANVIGLYHNIQLVLDVAKLQAKITHNTSQGIVSAQVVALMTHYFVYQQGSKVGLIDFLNKHIPNYNWQTPHNGRVACDGIQTVRAAITAIMRSNTLAGVLYKSVAFGGDTDSVATIAMGAACCCGEITRNLPDVLYNNLENGEFGRDFLIDLDGRLIEFLNKQKITTT